MKLRVSTVLLAAGLAFGLGSSALVARPGTSFTYQGHLADGGPPVNGSPNATFRRFDAASGGSQLGSPQGHAAKPAAERCE